MADAQIDTDAYTWSFQLTKVMHRDVYPAIDPTNKHLFAEGKTVLITGGGGTIRKAWATAHAHHFILAGRSTDPLEQAVNGLHAINPTLKTTVQSVDTRNAKAVAELFEALAKQDVKVGVLIDTAGAINNCHVLRSLGS